MRQSCNCPDVGVSNWSLQGISGVDVHELSCLSRTSCDGRHSTLQGCDSLFEDIDCGLSRKEESAEVTLEYSWGCGFANVDGKSLEKWDSGFPTFRKLEVWK
jgi:hypothetical protein